MTQKAKSENNASLKKPQIKAAVKAARIAVARRLAVNHNETPLRSPVTLQR
jgi:hypothetical protein